ncbi:MAG: hypothetical protein IKE73_03610 [Bacilli bacterium]|nr:hypothetical protein [Bacilli bacterium]
MDIVNISKKRFETLITLDLDNNITNTEAKIYSYVDRSGKHKIFKNLHRLKGSIFANKLYTLEMLDNNKDYLPTSFVIPEKLVTVNGKVMGCSERFVDGTNLQVFLDNPKNDLKEKIKHLKMIGEILKQLDYIRKDTPLKSMYLNDLHAGNFIVNKDGELEVVDLDSSRICDNKPFPSKYLSSKSILNLSTKYKIFKKADTDDKEEYEYRKELGYVDADENSDLFCYNMTILNFLYRGDVNKMNIDDYYNYIYYLKEIGFDHNLINSFEKLIMNTDNDNPIEYLDTIDYKLYSESSKTLYKKALKKGKN